MKGWYFATEKRKLRFGDDREIIVGKAHTVKGPVEPCKHGLHASKNLLDALSYAPGAVLYLVELSHGIIHDDDKSVAQRRKYLQGGVDITPVLREFARKCALSVIDKWEAPAVVVEYLTTGNEDLRSAAWSAAESAAVYAAAVYAARSAAVYAAQSAAVYAAAVYAAQSAAVYAAYAAQSDQDELLTNMVLKYWEDNI